MPAPLRLAILLLALASPAAAQGGGTPRARMDAFLAALDLHDREALRPFFPASSEWTWIQTTHGPGVPPEVSVQRFTGAETLRAITNGSAVCSSLLLSNGHYGPMGGTLGDAVNEHGPRWRRAGRARFAPRARGRPYTYVEWKREDGRWVIARLADELHVSRASAPLPLGERGLYGIREVPRGRRAAFAPTQGYAAGAPWYEDHRPILFDAVRYLKYGTPRPTGDGELARVGALGEVAVYVEAGDRRRPGIIYLPVRPGAYQPYQFDGPARCYDP